MQAADFFKGKMVLAFAGVFRPCPRLLVGAPKEAKVFELLAVVVGIEYPEPGAAKLNAAIKGDNCVYDFAEVVGNVGGIRPCVGLAACCFMDVSDSLFEFVVLGVNALHCLNGAALSVGVVLEGKRLILPFEFLECGYVFEVLKCHLLPLSGG